MGSPAESFAGEAFTVVCQTSDRDAWLAARKTGIGASDIAIILGLSTHRSELALYAEKIDAIPADDISELEHVRWGNLLEPIILEQFGRQTGRKVTRGNVLLRSNDYPWALLTADGWIESTPDQQVIAEPWYLEIKNASAWLAEDWVNGPPDHYMAQVQQGMLVTNTTRATIACLLGGNRLVWCDVPRDETWIRRIIYHGERFWRRIQEQDPPLPDGSESSSRVLSKMFPADDGTVIELPAVLSDVVEQWQALKSQAKTIDAEIKLRENQIKATLGDAQRGVFHGGGTVSWKTQFKQSYSVKASTSRVLRWHPPEED